MAVSGDLAVAGAPGDDSGKGSAYVFVKPPAGWGDGSETAKLTATDRAANDLLGTSVGASGDTVVAGAPNDDSSEGSVYLFAKPVGSWASATETQKLTASDGSAGDRLGSSVGVSGDAVVAGAPFATGRRKPERRRGVRLPAGGRDCRGCSISRPGGPGAGVVLRWRTGSEMNLAGFDVYREEAGRRVRVNRAPLAAASFGAVHRLDDRAAPAGAPLRYALQAVALDGTKRWLGTTGVDR